MARVGGPAQTVRLKKPDVQLSDLEVHHGWYGRNGWNGRHGRYGRHGWHGRYGWRHGRRHVSRLPSETRPRVTTPSAAARRVIVTALPVVPFH